MAHDVKRSYNSKRRSAGAQRTRAEILRSARTLFLAQGYAATTVAQIARDAGVAVDTIYAAVGGKPDLLRLLLEAAISGTNAAVPAEEREYVQRVRAEPSAQEKLTIYADALAQILPRLAPLESVALEVIRQVPEIAAIVLDIHERRARNMSLLAEELASTGQLRQGLTTQEVADTLWATNSAAFYELLMNRPSWTPNTYGHWLAQTWIRLFLRPATATP